MLHNFLTEHEDPQEKTRAIKALIEQNNLFSRYLNLNFISHCQVYAILYRYIATHYDFPFTMVDLSCGDASMMAHILKSTRVNKYIGIDLANHALNQARKNMDRITCRKSFIQADFYDIARVAVGRADIIWLNVTMHHLSELQKELLIQYCADMLSGRGCLLIYDPITREPESREQYIERWWSAHRTHIQNLARHASPNFLRHAYNDDYPFSMSQHKRLGWENGFSTIRALYTDPSKCYSLICYSR